MFNYDLFLLHSYNIIKSLPIPACFCSYLLVKNVAAGRREWASLSCCKHRFIVSWMLVFSPSAPQGCAARECGRGECGGCWNT